MSSVQAHQQVTQRDTAVTCQTHPFIFTREEVLGSQVADTQAEDGEFVQTGGDLLRERQQAGQPLQLPVQPVSVPFGRVGLGPFSRCLLHPDNMINGEKGHN